MHFVWGVTLELLRVTELFVDQNMDLKKTITDDAIPVLRPIPCGELIADIFKKGEESSELVKMDKGEFLENMLAQRLTDEKFAFLLLTVMN